METIIRAFDGGRVYSRTSVMAGNISHYAVLDNSPSPLDGTWFWERIREGADAGRFLARLKSAPTDDELDRISGLAADANRNAAGIAALEEQCRNATHLIRWSDGYSHAVVFPFLGGRDLAARMEHALRLFRFARPNARAELHVRIDRKTGRWTDPVITWGVDEEMTRTMGKLQFDNVPGGAVWPYGGYVHVINCVSIPPDPPEANPVVRGTDYVLIVGPGSWHECAVANGIRKALQYTLRLNGFISDVVESIQDDIREEPPNAEKEK